MPRFIAILLMMLFTSVCSSAATFNVQRYGAKGDGQTDDRAAIQSAIDAAISAGSGNTVYLPATNACYALSADSQSTREELHIFRSSHLTFRGDGTSSILCIPSSTRNIFYWWNNNDLTVEDMVWKRTSKLFTQMVVDAIDTEHRTVLVTVQEGYSPPNAPNIFAKSIVPLLLVFSDPSSGSWGDHLADSAIYGGNAAWPPNVTGVTKTGRQWTLRLNAKPQANYVGAVAVEWPATSGGGGSAVIGQVNGHVLVRGVDYYAEGAEMGFNLQGNVGPWTLDNVRIVPGSGECISAKGGSYILNNHSLITIKNSTIVDTWDDNVNVGANSARVYSFEDPETITVDGSRADWLVGDMFGVWDWTYKAEFERGRALLKAISCMDKVCRLTFDRPIRIKNVGRASSKAEDQDGIDRVVDISDSGSLVVTNSVFNSLHARDLVFRSSNTVISGNTFRDTVGPAIYTGFDWDADEGPASTDVMISGNVFDNISSTNIMVGGEGDGATYSTRGQPHQNFAITNNSFNGFGQFSYGIAGKVQIPIYLRGAVAVVKDNSFRPFRSSATVPDNGVNQVNSTVLGAQGVVRSPLNPR